MVSAALLSLFQQGQADASLGPPAPTPPVVQARIGPAERWTIQTLPRPVSDANDTHRPITFQVRGQRVVFRPIQGYEHLYGVQRGTDDSFLVTRGTTGTSYWGTKQEIWLDGKSLPMPYGGASVYRDRRNYAGIHSIAFGAQNLGGGSNDPIFSYVLRDGKVQELGPGGVEHWGKDDVFVLSVNIDQARRPAGDEFKTSRATRIVQNGREWTLFEYDFLGRMNDGTLAFVSPQNRGIHDYGLSLEPPRPQTRVLLWRGGAFVSHVALPERWRVEKLSPEGWILVRQAPPSGPNFGEDPLIREERTWKAARLRGEELIPIEFPRPKGSERLLWREGPYQIGANSFRFHAFWDKVDRWYRLTRR